jgi:C1A family cysteine protease
MAHVYGWTKDPRTKLEPNGSIVDLIALDKKFPDLAHALKMTMASGDIDLSPYCIAMDQYQLSSCVGNATCESLEILENIATGNATILSRLFTYAMARTEEGTLNVDGGTHVRTAFDTLSRFGVCTEDIWPYDMNQVDVSPSILAQQQAVGHKLTGYYRITTTGDQRLADIQTALYNKHPVVIGTDVGDDFENLPQGSLGPLGPPSIGTIRGGHALVVVGYIGGNYLIKNSWGTGWGKDGFCLFTPDYLTWIDTSDLWVPTIAPVFTP